jgi:hypothetical protein
MLRIVVMVSMATDSSDPTPDDPDDDVAWANQEAYRRETAETKDVVLPDGQMKLRVSVMQPTKFASLIDEYGIADMAEDLSNVDPDTDLTELDDVELDDVEPEDLEELGDRFRVVLFFRDVMVPQVVKPNVHWANPAYIGDPDWFDLSELTERDRTFLIGAITGQDPETLLDAAEDRAESFPG